MRLPLRTDSNNKIVVVNVEALTFSIAHPL
jgi:hypothetical protein